MHKHKPFINPYHDALKPNGVSIGDGSVIVVRRSGEEEVNKKGPMLGEWEFCPVREGRLLLQTGASTLDLQ